MWYLRIESEGRPGAENMALDGALLVAARDAGVTHLRIYRWSPPCLSFGRNEPALRRYDRDAIAARGWDVVRRPTGGRAVWHENEITYAIAAPVAQWGSLKASYFAIHRMLAAGLRYLGVAAQLAQPGGDDSLGAGPCFASAAGGEVAVGSRKVIGSAQYREGGAFLQHGSILLGGTQGLLDSVTRIGATADTGTTLGAVMGRQPTFAEVAGAITKAASDAWGPPSEFESVFGPKDFDHYLSEAWTWRR